MKISVIYKNEEKDIFVEEILAMILQYLKKCASNYLGEEIKNVVMTVPCYFNYIQRQSIKDAVIISGLNNLRLIDESDSTCLGYYYNSKFEKDINVIIFNLGAGFLSGSLINISDGTFEL